jgi:hypothetical protein
VHDGKSAAYWLDEMLESLNRQSQNISEYKTEVTGISSKIQSLDAVGSLRRYCNRTVADNILRAAEIRPSDGRSVEVTDCYWRNESKNEGLSQTSSLYIDLKARRAAGPAETGVVSIFVVTRRYSANQLCSQKAQL